jgi:hypothetical protein
MIVEWNTSLRYQGRFDRFLGVSASIADTGAVRLAPISTARFHSRSRYNSL